MPSSDYAPLDEALSLIAHYGPELDNGNFNHAPMVAEALCALGRPEAVMPWLERYQARMTPRQREVEPISAENCAAALGRRERFARKKPGITAEALEPFRTSQRPIPIGKVSRSG